jgi:hypothetical protein
VASTVSRVRTGFGKSWKVLEIDNGFFQDLASFGKWLFGPLGYEKLWIFCSLSSLYLAKNCFRCKAPKIFFVSTAINSTYEMCAAVLFCIDKCMLNVSDP